MGDEKGAIWLQPVTPSGQGAPSTLGKYRIIGRLATGGMGEIFIAELRGDAGFSKLVVIKSVLPHLAEKEHFRGLLLNEARIAARLSHPNICQVFELLEHGGRHFIAMEYLEGVTLSHLLRAQARRGRYWELALVAGIFAQAGEGLHYVHELCDARGESLRILHRDISPSNLFITINGVTKILDFGIAKDAQELHEGPCSSLKGKYAYMSPEQLRGQPLDQRSDVFSLATVLFETVTGRRLFHRATSPLTAKALLDEEIPDPQSIRPLPDALAAAIRKGLARDTEQRFASAREFGAAVAESVGGEMSAVDIARSLECTMRDLVAQRRELVARALDSDGVAATSMVVETLTTPIRRPSGVTGPPTPLWSVLDSSVDVVRAAGQYSSAARYASPQPLWQRLVPWLLLFLLMCALGGYFIVRMERLSADRTVVVVPAPHGDSPGDEAPMAPPVPEASQAPEPTSEAQQPALAARSSTPAEPSPTMKKPMPVRHNPRKAHVRSRGRLSIDSKPYAVIFVDGRKLGETPLVELSLPAGRHRLRAQLSDGRSRTIVVRVRPGTLTTRRFHWYDSDS